MVPAATTSSLSLLCSRTLCAEATVALWVMLRRFDFEYVHGDAEPALKTAIILTCKNGMPMKVTPRGTAPRSVGAAQRR